MEMWPCRSATCLAEQPRLDSRRVQAPADTSSSATSMWFPAAAACSGVRPGRGWGGIVRGGAGGGVGEASSDRNVAGGGQTLHGRGGAGREVPQGAQLLRKFAWLIPRMVGKYRSFGRPTQGVISRPLIDGLLSSSPDHAVITP